MYKRSLFPAIFLISFLILMPLAAQPPGGTGGPPSGGPFFQGGPGGPGGPGGSGHGGRMGRGGFLPIPPPRVLENVLGLSEEQLGQVKSLLEGHKETVSTFREQLRDLHEAVRSELDSENPDAATVGGLVIESHATQALIKSATEALIDEFESILTAEQLERFEEWKSRRGGRRRPRG